MDEFSQGSTPYVEDDSYERQLQEYGHSQRERRERSSQSPPGYIDIYNYERGSQSGQDFEVYDSQHRYTSYRSVSPTSDREMDVNNDTEYTQYKARTPSDERFYKYYEESRSRDRSHSSDSEQRYRLTSEVVRRRSSRSRSPTMKPKRTKELPISYRSHSPPTPTDDEPYFHSDNSPTDFTSAYRKYESYRKRPSSVDDDKKSSVLLNTGLRKEIEAKSEVRLSRKRSYDQLSPKRAESLQRLERQHSRGSRADSTYEYSAKELLTKVQKLRSELSERTGGKDSPSSGSSSDIDPSTLTEAELAKLHREKTKLLQKLNTLEDPGNNSDDSESRYIASKKARLEHKYLQKPDSMTKQEIKEKLKLLDETQSYRKMESMRKKELLRDLKKSKSVGESKKDLFDYSEEDVYNSPHDFPQGYMPKKRRKVESDSDKQSRSYRSRLDDEHGYSSDDDKERQELIQQSSAHADLYSPKARAVSSLDARLESDIFASHSKEDSRRVSSGSDNNKEQSEHSSRSRRHKNKKDNHITPLIPLGDDEMPDPETADPRIPRGKHERTMVLPLPEFAQFIQFSPLPSPCHSPERYNDLPNDRERQQREAATGSGNQSPCFSPQSSSSKTHSPSQSPSGSGSDSKGNAHSEVSSGDVVPPGFPTESEQMDPDETKADSLDSVADPSKTVVTKETKPKNDDDDSFSDNNSDIDLTSDNLSIEERIRQLDEKWNKAQAVASITPKVIPDVDSVVGNTPSLPTTLPSYTPPTIMTQGANSPAVSSLYSKYKIRKRNDASGSTSEKSEQSEIVQTVLSKSSIFDQDSKRLGQTNDTTAEGKDLPPSVNDNSPKSYSAWNKNDPKENPMVTVPGSLLDRLGQGSNGSFPTLSVNTTFPSVTNNVSLHNPVVSCSSSVYNYDKAEKLSPLVNNDLLDKNGDLLNTKGVVDTDDISKIRDQTNSLNDKLWQSENKVKSEDILNDIDQVTVTENSHSGHVKSENDTLKPERNDFTKENNIKHEPEESNVKVDSESKVSNKEDLNNSNVFPDNKINDSETSLKLESLDEMDTSITEPAVGIVDTKTDKVVKDESVNMDIKVEAKEEQTDSHKSETKPDTKMDLPDKTKIEPNNEPKPKSILKKSSELDLEKKMDTDTVKVVKSEEKIPTDKSTEKEKHLHKQSSSKSEKDESSKEPSAKKQKVSKDKEKRSDSSHREDKHKKKDSEKKSDSSSHKSSSSEKKDEKSKEKEKSKHKSDKDKKESEKKASTSKDEKKDSKDEKKKKSDKKEKKEEKKEEKSTVKESKEEKSEKVVKEKKEVKSDKEGEKSSDKKEKGEKKEKHEKKEKDTHKHTKHGKSPEKKSKSSHKEGDSKEPSKDKPKDKETLPKDSSKTVQKESLKETKDHSVKESTVKEPEKEKEKSESKEKVEVKEKEKEKSEKKTSESKKEHKSSHKVKKSKDENSTSKKAKEETEHKKLKEESAEPKKNKDDEKKVKDDHSEHKKKDEVNNRNNKDSPDKSKDVNRKEGNEKKGLEKTKDKTNGDKCKEEKSKNKEKENKDKDPDHSKPKSKPSSTTESGDKAKVYVVEDTKVEKPETEKDDSKKSDSKKEEKKNKDSDMSKNSNSASKLSSKDSDKKSSTKLEKPNKIKSSEPKQPKIKTPESSSRSRKETPKKRERERGRERVMESDGEEEEDGLTEADRLIFAQFAEEPNLSMYDKVKRRSTEKKKTCEKEQEEQKKLLHEYKRKGKTKNSLSDITESSEDSSDEERKEDSIVQKSKKKFAFSSDDSDSSTDTNVLQTKSNKAKTQTKKPIRVLDIYSSDSEEDFSSKTPVKKSIPTKKKKAEVHRDCDHKFDFDSISDSDNKTSATQQAKPKTAPKANKKVLKPKSEMKPASKNMAKKDSKVIKPKRKDFDLKALFSDDSDESMLSDSSSGSDIMVTPKTKRKSFLDNHINDELNRKKQPRGSAIYTSSEESETDDEFMSPPKTTVLPKKVEKRDSFFKEPIRKDIESDSFSSDHDEKFFEANRVRKGNNKINKHFSDSFESDGFSSDHTSPKYRDPIKTKKNNKINLDNMKLDTDFDKKKLEKEFREDFKHFNKVKSKKFNEIITDELDVAKVYESLYEKETRLSNLTNKDNLPPVLADITREPMFKLDVEQVKADIPSLKDISLDISGKNKNKKHKKENKKKKKNKEKTGKDSVKDVQEQPTKKSHEVKDAVPKLDVKSDSFIPDSDSENTGAVNRNLFDVIKSPPHNSGKKSHSKKEKKDPEPEPISQKHGHAIDHRSDGEFLSDSERSMPSIQKEKPLGSKEKMARNKDVFDFQDDDNGIKPVKDSHKKHGKAESHDTKKQHHQHEKETPNSVPIEVQGVEIEYTTDEHDYKDEGNICPIVETTEVVIEQAIDEVKTEKEKTKPRKKKGKKPSGKDIETADLTHEAVSALVKDERPVEDIQTEIVQFETPVSNEQELVIDEGVSLHVVEDETDKAVESILNVGVDETAQAVSSILFDDVPTYAISEPVEPTPQLDQNYLQPEFAPSLPNVPQVGTEVEANTTGTPLKGKKGRKPKRNKSGQGDALVNNDSSNKMVDGKPFDLLSEDTFASVIQGPLDTNDDDDDGRLQIDFDPPKPEVKQKKPRKPKQTKANKMNDAAALAAENKLDNLFGNFHRGQEKDGEINRDSLSSENSELERSKHEELLFMDREDQRHDSDMMSPDERSTSDDLTSPTDVTKVKSRRGRKPKNKDPTTAPIPRTNSPRASRTLSPRSPRSNFDPRSPKSDSFDAKLNGPKSLVIDEGADMKGNKLGTNVFDFDDNDEHGLNTTQPQAVTPKQRKPYRRRKGEEIMQSPTRVGLFSPEHKPEDKLVIGSPEMNGMFSPEHKANYPLEKKGLFSPSFQPEQQKIEVKHVADDKPPEPLFKAFFEAKSKTDPDVGNPLLARKNSKELDSTCTPLPGSLIISNVDKTIDDVAKGLFESTDDEAVNGPNDQTLSQKKKQTKKAKEEDIKSPGAKSPIKSPVAKSPMVKSPAGKSPVVNPMNSPPIPAVTPGVHHPLVLPGMGIGQAVPYSQPQIGEPQLAGHIPMMSPPIPVSTARPIVSTHPGLGPSMPEVSKQSEMPKHQEPVINNLYSPPGKTVPHSPVRTTVLMSPQKHTPVPTMAQSPISTTTSVTPSNVTSPGPANATGSKLENAMEGVLKGAMPGFLVPGISASSAMNVVQGISTTAAGLITTAAGLTTTATGLITTATVSQTATVVTTMSDLQKRQQQMDKLAQDQQMQNEQKQVEQKQMELQKQQEHHIKLKEQEMKMMEIERKEMERKEVERKETERKDTERKETERKETEKKETERKQIEEQKKLHEELKNKEEKKKQLEKLHEQLRQQQAAAMHGVTIGPGGQPGQPPLLSPGAMQRARASLPSPAEIKGPRPHLPGLHQMQPGAPFGLPVQHPGAPVLRPGQIPAHWAPGMVQMGQDELFMKHQQLQQQIAQAQAQAQKAQAQSYAELQAQIAKQQAQQAQVQAKQTAQHVGKPGPQPKAPQNAQHGKKTPEAPRTPVSQPSPQTSMSGKDAPLPGSQEAANQLTLQIKQQLAMQAKQQQHQQGPQPQQPQHPAHLHGWPMQHMRPEMAGMRPEMPGMMQGMRPEMPGIRPEMPGMRPEMAGIRPEMPGMRPEMAGMRPEMTGMRPEMAVMRPEMAGMRPEMAGMRPEMPGMRPETAGMRPEMPGMRPDMPGMRPDMPPNMRPELQMQHIRPEAPKQPVTVVGPMPAEPRTSVAGPVPGLPSNQQQVQRVSPHQPTTKSPTVAQTAPNMVHGFTQHQTAAPRAPSPAVAKVTSFNLLHMKMFDIYPSMHKCFLQSSISHIQHFL